MTLFTNKDSHEILCFTDSYEIASNGYPLDKRHNTMYPDFSTMVYENVEVPDTVDIVTPYKYCYTPEKGFYANPYYVEPTNQDDVKDNAQALLDLGDYVATLEARITKLEGKANG